MRSTTTPTNRKRASSITRAIWRWCARASRTAPWCCRARRLPWKPSSTRARPLYAWLRLARRYGAAEMPEVRLSTCARTAGGRQFLSPPLRAAALETLAGASRRCCSSIVAAMRRSRLCRLRTQGDVPELFGVAGRTPLSQAPVCHHCGYERRPSEVPAMRGRELPHRLRTGCRADGGGIPRHLSRCARGGRVERHAGGPPKRKP